MKKLLVAVALLGVLTGSALAQWDVNGSMGFFFSDTVFTDATTNSNPALSTPFDGWVVILGCDLTSVGGYEVGITVPATILVLTADGPNGWLNFGGSNTNHLVGYFTPVPIADGAAVLGHLQMMDIAGISGDISFGPAVPSSFANLGPGIANGANPDDLRLCHLTSGATGGTVATLHGSGITATENDTWTGVKDLFR